MNYKIAAKIINNGESKIFNSWKEIAPNLNEDEFLENLKWVYEDPFDENERLTRGIGLLSNGHIVHLKRIYTQGICCFYRNDNNELWMGDIFRVPCTEKFFTNPEKGKDFLGRDGKVSVNYKLSLSARDEI